MTSAPKSGKHIALSVIGGFAVAVAALTSLYLWQVSQSEDAFTSSPGESQYIQLCSGLTNQDQATYLIGVANCLGRIRGFVDSHQMTIKMQPTSAHAVSPLWCVDSSVTDKEVLDAVTDWYVENLEESKTIASQLDSVNAATAIAVRAIHETFPCKD